MFGNVHLAFGEVLGESSEIHGKWSEIFGKSSKTSLSVCLYNKKNVTRYLEDMNFMFSWQKQYLTRSLRSLVKYFSTLKEKRGHIIFATVYSDPIDLQAYYHEYRMITLVTLQNPFYFVVDSGQQIKLLNDQQLLFSLASSICRRIIFSSRI